MSANSSDMIETMHRAGREAAGELRRRAGNARDCTAEELRAFVADVEELVKRVGTVSDAEVARARTRVVTALDDMHRRVGRTGVSMRERARAAAEGADDFVRERPWQSIGLAAAAGLIVGAGASVLAVRR